MALPIIDLDYLPPVLTNPESIPPSSVVLCGQFNEEHKLDFLDSLDFSLPFDNNLEFTSFNISPPSSDSSFNCLIDNNNDNLFCLSTHFDIECDNNKTNLQRGISLFEEHLQHLKDSTNINVELDSSNKINLHRGVSIFEDHLQYLKEQDELNLISETEFNESLLAEELSITDFSFILQERNKREQNNQSSKKSRANRKRKFQQMKEESDSLEIENNNLKRKILQIDEIIKKCNQKLSESLKRKSVNYK